LIDQALTLQMAALDSADAIQLENPHTVRRLGRNSGAAWQ